MNLMPKIFGRILLLLVLLSSVAMAGTVQIIGTIHSPTGNSFNGSIKFQLPFAGAVDTNCPGSCMVVPTTKTATITNGSLPASLILTRNGDISPGGTYYRAYVYDSYGGQLAAMNFVIPAGGTTFDLGAALQTSITTNNVSYINPASTTGNNTWTGINIFSNINNIQYATALTPTGGIQEAIGGCVGRCLVMITNSSTISSPIIVAGNNVELQCTNVLLTAGGNITMVTLSGQNDSIRNCGLDGNKSSFPTSTGVLANSVNPLIEHNQFTNFNDTVTTPAAVNLSGSTNAKVMWNSFSLNTALAIYGENGVSGALIDGNDIDQTTGIAGSHAIAFHSTTIGKKVSDIRILNNNIINGLGFCVEFGAFGGDHATNFAVNDNTCKSGVAGGEGGYSVGSFTDGFTFHGNSFDANGFNSTIGCIELVQATDGAVTSNACKIGTAWSSPTSAIVVNRSTRVNVANNTIDGFGAGATAAGIYSLTVVPATAVNSNNINSNDITFPSTNTNGFGIWQQCADGTSTCNNNIYVNNNVRGNANTTIGIQIQNDAGTSDNNVVGVNNLSNLGTNVVIGAGVTNSSQVIEVGVRNNGSGFKHKRGTAGCATGASVGAACTTVVTWTTAFVDANYTAQCNGRVITSGVPGNGGITAQVAASVTFQTVAETAAVAQFTNIDCIAVHD